jgi:hypothetical protein
MSNIAVNDVAEIKKNQPQNDLPFGIYRKL